MANSVIEFLRYLLFKKLFEIRVLSVLIRGYFFGRKYSTLIRTFTPHVVRDELREFILHVLRGSVAHLGAFDGLFAAP